MSEFNLEDASGVHATLPEEITFEEGVAKFTEGGYAPESFVELWDRWIARGDIVLIFQNADLGHRDLGHVISMPWYSDRPVPPHAPDSTAGFGWRYTPRWVVKAAS